MSNSRSTPPYPKLSQAWETRVLFAGFLLVGIISVLLGPLIPELEAEWGVDHAQTGSLFLVQFAASSIGAMISSLHLRRSIVSGYLLASAGLAGVVWGGWVMARPAMAILGFALGLVISGSNLMVAGRNPRRRGAALAALNLTWGIGAVTCPLLFTGLTERIDAFDLVAILAASALVVGVALALVLRDTPYGVKAARGSAHGALPQQPAPVALLGLVAALLFLYVGIETSVGGWLVTLSDQLTVERSVLSLVIGSGFWGALLLGRTCAALLLRRVAEPTMYWLSLAVAGIGTGTLFWADSRAAIGAGAVLAGLGLAALYPLTVSILAEATSTGRSRVAGLIMAFGGFGGALLPWLTGRLSETGPDGAGSLSRGFLVPTAGLLVMAGLYLAYRLPASPRA